MLSPVQLQQYLQRTGFNDSCTDSLGTLQLLHHLHPQTIPFENLDSWRGVPVVVDTGHVFNKLVLENRGGYCYEHNWLFMQVLRTLGFSVHGLAARVHWMQAADFVPPRTHMALLVEIADKRYLCDVGFGGQTMTAPLLLDHSGPQSTPNETLSLTYGDSGVFLVQTRMKQQWQPMFSFTLEPQQLPDYQQANWFVSTHPESRFVQNLVCARVEGKQRHALLNNRYTLHCPEKDSETMLLQSPDEIRQILTRQFRINLDSMPDLDKKLIALFRQ